MKNPHKGVTGLRRLTNALGYSLAGLAAAFRDEQAFRQVLLAAAVLIPIALWLPVTPAERALLIGSVLLAAIVELLNSGVEAAVDRVSFKRHPLAKRAKDIASAAVLLSLINAAAVWSVILLG
ncbi:MAG: diacylglycerol kinase [Gammaproteobacteria bacterium]|nr:diacylglycerol kinase [Gammaproteobacteria bacterium]